MKIGLRGGHSSNCLGTIGLRNEYATMQVYFKYVKEMLEKYGHTVIDCNSNANTEWGEVSEGFNKANNNNVDLFISLHMNSYDGQAHGVECLVAKNSSVWGIAERICDNFATLGFYNRGVKVGNQWEMQYVNAPNIIFETCFCDSETDINIWSPAPYEKLTRLLCNAIDSNIPLEDIKKRYQIRVYTFTNREDAEKASKAIGELGYYNSIEEI